MLIVNQILNEMKHLLEPLGFECYPFKLEWYNECVDERFRFEQVEQDTLAVLVLNTPSTFEKLFLEFLFNKFKNDLDCLAKLNDPIDECMDIKFNEVKKKLFETLFKDDKQHIDVEIIKDYDISPGTRRAKIVMQTVAHVSGAAYFYDPKKYCNLEKYTKKNLMGCCLHPIYGGWIAFRSVFIFKNLKTDTNSLIKKEPVDSLNGNLEKIVDFLEKFNFSWRDSRYRDVIQVKEKYSYIQQQYFLTLPKDRKDLIKQWLIHFKNSNRLCSYYVNKSKEDYFVKNFYY